ncbi:Major facilitator superfamily domain, general substrate transporter [Cordyceps fumosorosea ARSEF 2679]|uniref:Major facilitator superfamily domain, general substrate transporter n=1 Tax=Cordyceps fumosorosea (strain ARSEF 2679) TaxID=1081104 RepID=A0A167AD20_CORFA|nr:Major facilitator superfamily domain, general substrate transporter [Cordyceps fumosorosea ARSEF 2679]OAA38790.1 Major facilitator superfamily domain, general substrate transporter [Cordyceps fumosorosea ARSEF 2679]
MLDWRLSLGAFISGILSDTFGRKWVFSITCMITCVFGMLLAAVKFNYGAICGIYFLACIGLGGNIPINATIALEFMPPSKRHLVSLLSIFQPIGVVIASVIAYGTAAKFRFHESPKFLVAMAMYTQVKNTAGFVGLNAFEYIMQIYFNSVLYASAPELFETTYRASATGMLSSLGRIAYMPPQDRPEGWHRVNSIADVWTCPNL